MPVIFPFSAIVGQERMLRALILNAVNTRIGGVLIRGERGTAKSTAARALAALLPSVRVVKDCKFGCDPDHPETWCTECVERAASGEKLPFDVISTPFVNLPVSATEDRVVGTLDIEKAIQKGERHFEPGVLAAANRGLLYIDEVNLLDDHVVDILLDSAAMGMNIVEREGISFSHPARFILVGTMNPEEGDLRPQLLDRFALSVEIRGIKDARERVAIMERNLQYEADPEAFRQEWMPFEEALSKKIDTARKLVDKVKFTSRDLLTIAALTSSMNVEGHRSDIVILKTARAQAAFDGRLSINEHDIALAAELALPHRIKHGPFHQGDMTADQLEEKIEELIGQSSNTGETEASPTESDSEEQVQKKLIEGDTEETSGEPEQVEPAQKEVFNSDDTFWWDGGKRTKTGEAFAPRRLDTPLDQMMRKSMGRRSRTRTNSKRGRYIQARQSNGETYDLALDATIRAAAPYQKERSEMRKRLAFAIRPTDYMRKIRVSRSANLVLFLVDASWSMAVSERMAATKGAILSLLTDAYQRRDRVGLIVFQKDRAILVLPPTNSVTLAERALRDIPVGGKTPLSAGLKMAYEVLFKEKILHPDVLPLLVVLTDGAGNVSMSNLPPLEESAKYADMIAHDKISSVVINMEHAAFDQGLAQVLADHMKAPCFTTTELKAENLYQAVRHAKQNMPMPDDRH